MNNEQNKHEKEKKPNYIARRIGALALASYIVFAAGTQTVEWIKDGIDTVAAQQIEEILSPCKFSDETTSYCLQQGEGFWAAASQVKGHESFDIRQIVDYIEGMPQNRYITEEGRIPQVGDYVTIPDNVKHK
jgi:hypothetical protein